jgi:hypothetical protein
MGLSLLPQTMQDVFQLTQKFLQAASYVHSGLKKAFCLLFLKLITPPLDIIKGHSIRCTLYDWRIAPSHIKRQRLYPVLLTTGF